MWWLWKIYYVWMYGEWNIIIMNKNNMKKILWDFVFIWFFFILNYKFDILNNVFYWCF